MDKNLSGFTRVVFALVGVTGLGSFLWALFSWSTFVTMPFWSIVAFVVAVIGCLNWGIVAVTGNRTKDLFGLLGL